jgi:cytochrome P450
MEYRKAVIADNGGQHGPLFPHVKMDKDGRRNKNASNKMPEWLNNLIPEKRKPFQSWRATVRTMLENNAVSPDRARYIVGHAQRMLMRSTT